MRELVSIFEDEGTGMSPLLEPGNWAVWVVGWPAIIVSLVCALSGLVLRRTPLMVLGAVIAMPFCFYLFMNPGKWRFLAPIIVITNSAATFAMSKGLRALSLLLLLPFIMVAGWIAIRIAG